MFSRLATIPTCYDGIVVSAPEPKLARADQLSQNGMDLLYAEDARGAAQAFRDAIAADPGHIEARHGLIRALGDAAEFEAAVNAARELTSISSDDPLAFASLSIALQKTGRIPEAEAAAGRARILEWKQQLAKPQIESDSKEGDEHG